MPVRQFVQSRSSSYLELVDLLCKEWQDAHSRNAEPVILEEKGRDGKLVHVYVVWDKWLDVDRAERSEIIMDAAEKSLSPGDLMNITIAMGLTASEARQMGLNF